MASADIAVGMLGDFTLLMSGWSSAATQSQVALDAGVAVNSADIPVLYVLGRDGACRAGELAHALRLTRPTMSKQLARLERAGLIERVEDPRDRRARMIRLSPAGATAHRRLVTRGVAMMQEALTGWDRTDVDLFAQQLTRFVTRLTDITTSGREPAPDHHRPEGLPENGEAP